MDLKRFDTVARSDEGVWSDILDPSGVEVVARFKIAGRDSKVLKRRQQELAKKAQSKRKVSSLEEEQDTIETISICTLEWVECEEGKEVKGSTITVDGKKLECNVENARVVYTMFPWIAEQVVEIIADRSRFLSK